MDTQIVLTRKSGKTQTFIPAPVLPASKQYYQIRQDDQIAKGLYKRNALNRPMVFRLETYRNIPFTKKMQEFAFDLNRTGNLIYDKRVYPDCFDTWATNARRIREEDDRPGHADYINNERLDRDDPSWANLVMGRNVLTGVEVMRGAVPSLHVNTLDSNNLPITPMTYETHPEFIHHCTIINDAMFGSIHKVLPFPQKGGKETEPKLPVYYPLMWDVPVYIPMWMLIKLPIGAEIPNPYNPVWNWSV